ncbi:MAG: hypothetical protein GX558_01460, partial [Clostridiales bacterium]|nr:hypothetical protein [Clostridiales bacterium]
MTGRERLIAALNRRPIDRLPWSLCMDGYYTSSLPEQGHSMDLLTTLRYFRNDIMERHVPIFRLVQPGVEVREERRGGGLRTVWTTPVGEICEDRLQTGRTWYIAKPPLATLDDVKVYRWIVEHGRYEPDFKTFLARDAVIGDDGLATPSGPVTPVQQLLQHLMRIENTVYLMNDEPGEMDELLCAIHRRDLGAYRILA